MVGYVMGRIGCGIIWNEECITTGLLFFRFCFYSLKLGVVA